MSKHYVYVMPPIDFGWEFCQSLPWLLKRETNDLSISMDWTGKGCSSDYLDSWNDIAVLIKKANSLIILAGKYGFDGNLVENPVLIPIPGECTFDFAFAFKQENNGTTFIVSPVAMHWLHDMDCVEVHELEVEDD